MRVRKYVEINQDVEVDIDISADDVAAMLCLDRQESGSIHAVLHGLSNIMQFLKAVPDQQVAELNEKQFALVVPFLAEQAERFRLAQVARSSAALADGQATATASALP